MDQHVRGQQCSTLMQAFKMRMSGSTQSKATSSWGWLEGALKGFCEVRSCLCLAAWLCEGWLALW